MVRMLKDRDVLLCLCGISISGKVGHDLDTGGILSEGVEYFETLNSALEFCENELLKALYEYETAVKDEETESAPMHVDVALQRPSHLGPPNLDAIYGSPRRDHLHQIATTTLAELSPPHSPHGVESDSQPLRIMLEVFRHVSSQPTSFWSKAAPFFAEERYAAGTVLYRSGEPPSALYVVASGILKADYDLEQGSYFETIVEGTTCGELPFFSDTARTSTTTVERDSTCWILTREQWEKLEDEHGEVATELLKVALALTKERMDNNIKHVLLQRG